MTSIVFSVQCAFFTVCIISIWLKSAGFEPYLVIRYQVYQLRLLTLGPSFAQPSVKCYILTNELVCTLGILASPFVFVHHQSSDLVPQHPQASPVISGDLQTIFVVSSLHLLPEIQVLVDLSIFVFIRIAYSIHCNQLFVIVFSVSSALL